MWTVIIFLERVIVVIILSLEIWLLTQNIENLIFIRKKSYWKRTFPIKYLWVHALSKSNTQSVNISRVMCSLALCVLQVQHLRVKIFDEEMEFITDVNCPIWSYVGRIWNLLWSVTLTWAITLSCFLLWKSFNDLCPQPRISACLFVGPDILLPSTLKPSC